MIQPWLKTWREGIAPQLDNNSLLALSAALISRSDRILQKRTCIDEFGNQFGFLKPVAFCPVGLCVYTGQTLLTVDEVVAAVDAVRKSCDQRLGCVNAFHFYAVWFDYSDRNVAFKALSRETRRELINRVGRSVRRFRSQQEDS